MSMTLKAAKSYLLGNPMRDPDQAGVAATKVLRTKSAPEWLKEEAINVLQEKWEMEATSVEEHNMRVMHRDAA